MTNFSGFGTNIYNEITIARYIDSSSIWRSYSASYAGTYGKLALHTVNNYLSQVNEVGLRPDFLFIRDIVNVNINYFSRYPDTILMGL